jgi:hypothetical protein
MARLHGISGFCSYHYWFNSRKIFERPFAEVLASGQPDFPFCLYWANENWTRRWDGSEHEILLKQNYSLADAEGCSGSGKRKYSLELIMARPDKGAETSIAIAFLVMCAEKIMRLLRLFFVTIFAWFHTLQRPGLLWVALRTICLLETAESLVTA